MLNHWPEIVMVGLGLGAVLRMRVGPLAAAAVTAALVTCGAAVSAWPGIDAAATLGAGLLAGASALADSMATVRAGGRRRHAPGPAALPAPAPSASVRDASTIGRSRSLE